MELERQREQEEEEKEKEKEDNAQRKAVDNKEKEEMTQVAVAVEIPRRKEASVRPATRDREDRNLRMKDSEETAREEGLEASQHTTTERTDTTPPINAGITT